MTVKDPSSFTTGEPLILAGGNVLTMNPAHPVADAIGIIGDQIQIVGTLEQVVNFMPGGSKKVQLEGRTVLPGLHDSHMHAWKVGQLLTKIVDLRDCNSWKELRKRVQAHKVRSSDEWTTGRGVNERFLPDLPARSGKGARLPDRDDLDTVLNDRPIALTRTCGHIAVANSRALDRAGIDRTTPDPEGGQIERDESG